jgi:hypothetical protein
MKTIWKFPAKVQESFELDMPKGARVLCVQNQGPNNPQMWALVDPSAPIERRRFRVAGTGHRMEDDKQFADYIGTYQLHDGDLVFHLFEDVRRVELGPSAAPVAP